MSQIEENLGITNANFFDEAEPDGQSDPEIAEQEIDFILRKENLHEGASVLDIPCGEGHHAQILAEKYGHNVIGIDGGTKLIDRAVQRYNKPKFLHGYFQDLAADNLVANESQDAVMCINQSFGYLPTLKENEDFLLNMYTKLKPGGVLVIQTAFNPNRSTAEPIPQGETRKYENIVYFSENDGPHVDTSLPAEYALSPEDENFRNLEITNSARLRDDGSFGARKKYANYLAVKHDNNSVIAARKPVDMPVLRSLARHSGIEDGGIEFHSEPYLEDGQTFYRCMMSIRKPIEPDFDNFRVGAIQGVVRDRIGN